MYCAAVIHCVSSIQANGGKDKSGYKCAGVAALHSLTLVQRSAAKAKGNFSL